MKRNRVFFGTLLVLLAAAAFGAQLDFASLPASTGSGNAIHPSLGINQNGQIMTAWWNESTNRILTRIYTVGGGWGSVSEIPGQSLPGTWPRVVGGAGNQFHVVWSAGSSEHNHSILYSRFNGSAFTSPVTVQSGLAMFPDICYKLDGNIVTVAWEEWIPSQANGEIMVRQCSNGSWGGKTNASKQTYWSGRVRIVSDDSGNLYAAWQQKTQIGEAEIIEAFYNRTVNGAWQTAVNLSNGNAWRFLPNIAVRPDGSQVYVQWYNYSDKYHWGRAIAYSGASASHGANHRIAHGSYDHLHYYTGMVYHQGVLYLSYVADDGNVWIKNYQGGDSWGNGGTLAGANCPRTPDLAQSAALGLATSWYNRCDSPNRACIAYGDGFGSDPDDPEPEPNKPPLARIKLDPSSGIYPLTVSLDGSDSSDSDGKIAAYAWTLSDGGGSSKSKFSHIFQKPGSHSIQLKVSDDDGDTATASALVTVYGMQPPLDIAGTYHQNRNLFSTEHYYRITWNNNPENENLGFNVTLYNIFRRLKGQSTYTFLTQVDRAASNEFLDRSLKNSFYDYEYTVTCQDAEGRTSDLPDGTTARQSPPILPVTGPVPEAKKLL